MSAFAWRVPRRKRVTRPVRAAAVILLYYLLQTCVMPYLRVGGVMPNLLMVSIAILTVAYGKKYAFVSGAVTGIILESMASNLRLFYVLVYPSLALVCAQAFADMSDVKREMRRISHAERQPEPALDGRRTLWQRLKRIQFRRTSPDDLNPHLRVPLNALLLTACYEVLMLAYVALEGVPVGFRHIGRTVVTLLYTMLCSVLLMVPTRAFLGMYRKRRGAGRADHPEETMSVAEDALLDMAVVPDMPDDLALTRAALRGKTLSDAIMDKAGDDEAAGDGDGIAPEPGTDTEEPGTESGPEAARDLGGKEDSVDGSDDDGQA